MDIHKPAYPDEVLKEMYLSPQDFFELINCNSNISINMAFNYPRHLVQPVNSG